MANISEFWKKTKAKIVYADCKPALKPVQHDSERPVLVPIWYDSCEDLHTLGDEFINSLIDEECIVDSKKNEPGFFNQEKLNDLVRDVALSKERAVVLGSGL